MTGIIGPLSFVNFENVLYVDGGYIDINIEVSILQQIACCVGLCDEWMESKFRRPTYSLAL